jgi:hypothetical protein
MPQGIEIHLDTDEGHLRLDCCEDEFTHIRDLVATETLAADRLGPLMKGIRSIVIRRMDPDEDTMPQRFRRGMQILVVSVVVFVPVVIQVIGIFAIARWVLGLGF